MTTAASSPEVPAGATAERYGRWLLLAVWGSLVLSAGPVLASALDARSRPVQVVASLGLWVAWATMLGAMLVPRTISLTVMRIVVPVAVPTLIWANLDVPTTDALGLAGLGTAVAATVVALSAFVGDGFVNGSSYGDERRMPLRPPGRLLAGPIPLAWAACAGGAVAGPLRLAAGSYIAGAVAVVVGGPVVYVAGRALHGLSRRWVVFVPAGFVLHDLMVLQEPILVPRRQLRRVGPALADTQATDYTAGALGLALQVDLAEPFSVTPVLDPAGGRRKATREAVEVQSLLFAPSRPGAVLAEAARRRVPVG